MYVVLRNGKSLSKPKRRVLDRYVISVNLYGRVILLTDEEHIWSNGNVVQQKNAEDTMARPCEQRRRHNYRENAVGIGNDTRGTEENNASPISRALVICMAEQGLRVIKL